MASLQRHLAQAGTTGEDPIYGKPTTVVSTPRVRGEVRRAFGCDVAVGMPLEDVPGGAGIHWESRVAGPEVMSYGTSTGATYVSAVTLAFLEDTNHFVVSNAGLEGELVRRGGSIGGDLMALPPTDTSFV